MSDTNVIALSRFSSDVRRAVLRRGKELLKSKDLAAEVQALEPLEAYFVIKELGVEDAVPLLLNASPEQLQAFVDLDCWESDRPNAAELDAWLAPFASESTETLARVFNGLEDELQVSYLAQLLDIYDIRNEEAPNIPDDHPRLTTPDGIFVIDLKEQGDRELDPFALIDALYKASLEETHRLLMAAKWESASEREEQAYQFREARLQDLGFPAPDEAAKIFLAPPNRPNTVQLPTTSAVHLPALYAAPMSEPSLITAVLASVSDAHQLDRLERDFVYLVNCAVIAYGGSPRDLVHVGSVATRVRDTLSLGLENLLDATLTPPFSNDVIKEAQARLAAWPLLDVFRFGFKLQSQLGREAYQLAQDPVVTHWLSHHETEHDDYNPERADRSFVRALSRRPHLHAGFELTQPDTNRAFGSKTELEEARVRLRTIIARVTQGSLA